MAETFTIREMNEAFNKFVTGQPLTEKERMLAETKSMAIRHIDRAIAQDHDASPSR